MLKLIQDQQLPEKEFSLENVPNTTLDIFSKMFTLQVEKGYKKYNTYLYPVNKRNSFSDTLQEFVDLLQYSTQNYIEFMILVYYIVHANEELPTELIKIINQLVETHYDPEFYKLLNNDNFRRDVDN